ncbi:hypothetical protein AB0J89_19785 [Micromonospora chokoriensis]
MNTARAELRKLLTLPSLRLTMLLTWGATALLAYAFSSAAHCRQGACDEAALAPLLYTQAGFLVLGALAGASEHQGGAQIRATLLAMPRRLPLQAAKALTLAGVALPAATVTATTSALVAGESARIPAATAYLTLTTLLGSAVAVLARRAVPAVLSLLMLHFVAGPLLRSRFDDVAAYLPDTAAVDPGTGLAATICWVAAATAAATAAFHLRDA